MIVESYDPRLECAAVRERYSDPAAYSGTDDWHRFTAARIRHEVTRSYRHRLQQPGLVVLNAGAGNNDLGLCPPTTINLDISESGLSNLPNQLIASVEDIPLADGAVDMVICVGSVINYCNAAAAIREFGRIVRAGGQLVLEFESSRSAEFIGSTVFDRPAAIAETFYQGALEVVRVYDPRHIRNLLFTAKFDVTNIVPIHIASPWALRVTGSIQKAAAIARFDSLLRFVPFLSNWSSNQLMFCRKAA